MSVKVSRIFHAGYILECDGTAIAFDTLFENPFSRNCFVFPKVEISTESIKSLVFDAIFISHYHDDHCSLESLNLLDRNTPLFIFCIHKEIFEWIRELGFKNIYPLALGSSVQVGPFDITPLPALDRDVDSLFHIKVRDFNILNVVDSWIDEKTMAILEQVKTWDLVMWPFQTMREIETLEPQAAELTDRKIPFECLHQIQRLKPKLIIPSSCQFVFEDWSWLNKTYFPISYELFEKQIAEALPDAKVKRLDPSRSIFLEKAGFKTAEPLPWLQLIGSDLDDYSFDGNHLPTPTSEVAKHFPEISASQALKIQNYIQLQMPKDFYERGPSQDEFFKKRRFWRLTLFDRQGQNEAFHFSIEEDQMILLDGRPEYVDWKTEIVAYKLSSALETGESLSSLYIRITKKDKVADPLEDPLIRCLFEGKFGSYQRAQLRKIIK